MIFLRIMSLIINYLNSNVLVIYLKFGGKENNLFVIGFCYVVVLIGECCLDIFNLFFKIFLYESWMNCVS